MRKNIGDRMHEDASPSYSRSSRTVVVREARFRAGNIGDWTYENVPRTSIFPGVAVECCGEREGFGYGRRRRIRWINDILSTILDGNL